jgi:hypothetical protein
MKTASQIMDLHRKRIITDLAAYHALRAIGYTVAETAVFLDVPLPKQEGETPPPSAGGSRPS